MKCPKCGYLGFGQTERCRNCGYDFGLTQGGSTADLTLRSHRDVPDLPHDLTLSATQTSGRAVAQKEPSASLDRQAGRSAPPELPLFSLSTADDVPLITKASPPRQPLAVRRATPEVQRLRSSPARAPLLDLRPAETEPAAPSADVAHVLSRREQPRASGGFDAEAAGLVRRLAAVAIDLIILSAIDVMVVYFTVEICGLSLGLTDLQVLPKGPLIAFLLVQNGGYLVAFTAGGQTLGKMAVGIRVVAERSDAPLDLARSLLRTVIWAALAVPAGLGFATAWFSRDHRGLHDRCAGTKVVRA